MYASVPISKIYQHTVIIERTACVRHVRKFPSAKWKNGTTKRKRASVKIKNTSNILIVFM